MYRGYDGKVHIRPALLLVLVLGLCVGCAETASPSLASVEGMYVLHSVAGERLPAPLATGGALVRIALADTLRFAANGEGEHVAVYQFRSTDGVGPVTTRRSVFQFGVEGDRISLAFVCEEPFSGRVVGGAAPPQMRGNVSRNALEFDVAFFFRTPLRYQRR